ncbi:hypothetical protein [Photobacterium minamisatsumaniensis]|uniref:hypothetical protein n=1 Tax=Photobacterium minamisatsumaniensis TaxID=2910233 RepID=UPI003D0FB995
MMFKWIGVVIGLLGFSLITTGLTSALLHLAAFFIVLRIGVKKAKEGTLKSRERHNTQALSKSDKIDVTP